MNAPIENLAGYYLEGDRYTVARVGRERPFGVPMLLSAYGQTLRYEDLIQGEGTAGTWCDDSTIEASFRQALEATRPELLVVPEGSTGLDVADIAELVAILATDEF